MTGAPGAGRPAVPELRPAVKVRDLTGPGLTDRFGVGGTDLGATTTAPGGRLVSVFGDTFRRAGVGGRGWRSPVVLFGDPASVGDGLRWTGAARGGWLPPAAGERIASAVGGWVRSTSGGRDRPARAGQVVRYLHNGPRRSTPSRLRGWRLVRTVLPTDVIAVGRELYLHVMVCRELGNVRWTELHRSVDDGATWRPTGVRWPADLHGGLFQMLTWCAGDDGWVHALTTGFQRAHGLVRHRVPAERLADPGAWEAWDGAGGGGAAVEVLPGRFGELCLRRLSDRWVLVCFDEEHYRIDVRVLDSPTADLRTAPHATVLQGCAWGTEDHAAGRVAQLYGGYVLPGSTLADLHLVVSQWNTATGWPYRAMQFRADVSGLSAPNG